MMRRARWIVLVVVVLLVALAAVSMLLVRPDLAEARDRVDARWADLRSELIARYDALGAIAETLDAAGARDRSVTRDLRAELARWTRLEERARPDPALEATIANNLEALERRALENFQASDRLRGNPDLAASFLAFDQQVASPPRVRAYNQAVRAYQSTRDGTFARLVAGVLGFDARPTLLVAPPG